MIYELRAYVIPSGRMPDILERFESATMDAGSPSLSPLQNAAEKRCGSCSVHSLWWVPRFKASHFSPLPSVHSHKKSPGAHR
jgi:hypothetical protein